MFKIGDNVRIERIGEGGSEHLKEFIGKCGKVVKTDDDTPNGEILYYLKGNWDGLMGFYESEIEQLFEKKNVNNGGIKNAGN